MTKRHEDDLCNFVKSFNIVKHKPNILAIYLNKASNEYDTKATKTIAAQTIKAERFPRKYGKLNFNLS